VNIATRAGVGPTMVRDMQKSILSNTSRVSDASNQPKRVQTSRGLRPRTWAVEANGHAGLERSNKDKQHSVLQLLNTDLGKSMSAKDIADRAGVEAKMVRRYQEDMKTQNSTGNAISDSSNQPKKVQTSRGRHRHRC